MKEEYEKYRWEVLECFKEQYSEKWEIYKLFYEESFFLPLSQYKIEKSILLYCDLIEDMNLIVAIIRELEDGE